MISSVDPSLLLLLLLPSASDAKISLNNSASFSNVALSLSTDITASLAVISVASISSFK